MYEVSYIPHGWDIETVGRFTDQSLAFRFAHLVCLVTGHVVFMSLFLEKNGRLVKDTRFITENNGGKIETRLWIV